MDSPMNRQTRKPRNSHRPKDQKEPGPSQFAISRDLRRDNTASLVQWSQFESDGEGRVYDIEEWSRMTQRVGDQLRGEAVANSKRERLVVMRTWLDSPLLNN